MDGFRILTAGESHGRTLGVTVDGVPAGLPLAAEEINVDLSRRQRGYGRGGIRPRGRPSSHAAHRGLFRAGRPIDAGGH